jgi:hypothetical protein
MLLSVQCFDRDLVTGKSTGYKFAVTIDPHSITAIWADDTGRAVISATAGRFNCVELHAAVAARWEEALKTPNTANQGEAMADMAAMHAALQPDSSWEDFKPVPGNPFEVFNPNTGERRSTMK